MPSCPMNKVLYSNCLFESTDIHFAMIYDKEKHQIVTFLRLKPAILFLSFA